LEGVLVAEFLQQIFEFHRPDTVHEPYSRVNELDGLLSVVFEKGDEGTFVLVVCDFFFEVGDRFASRYSRRSLVFLFGLGDG